MANKITTNNAPLANFKVFIAANKACIPGDLAKGISDYAEAYNRLHGERLKYTDTEVDRQARAIGERAASDPTPENIAAVSAFSVGTLKRNYENTVARIIEAQEALVARNARLFARLREIVLALVEGEISQAKKSSAALCAKYGVDYDASADQAVLSMERWRDVVSDWLAHPRGARPDQIAHFIGDLSSKRFLGLVG